MSDFTGAGFYPDVDEDDYHSGAFGPPEGSLSASGIKKLLKAPALYLHAIEHPHTTEALELGKCVHTALLGIGQGRMVIRPTGRTKAEQEAHREDRAEAAEQGLIPVTPEQDEQIKAMVASVRANRDASRLLASNWGPEVSAYAPDEATGLWRRCRWDMLRPDIGVDLKTARTASPGGFAKACLDFGYHLSASYYLDIAHDLDMDLADYAFIVIEKEPPYLCAVYRLDDDAMALGRRRYREGLRRFRECIDSGEWPGYDIPDNHTISLPGYAYKETA